ncbi:hypothetical protein MWN34_11405 [Ancylobacter sp. 6x-1]|uniref:ETC complex I subunit n=1 Tax=Ancylobacter crimeensis TaxID=2579147 RepID=A0ABT0DC37_9HYPH|nr:hypothetical protein [Ancylobacter crimeensis]MCK0197521.1 hypothetical protein [Ancylobacter crimeensis]
MTMPQISTGAPAKLQYWPASHSVDAPDQWPDSYEFNSLDDAVAFAMTQSPADREIAWLRTPDGEILKYPQILTLWELKHS